MTVNNVHSEGTNNWGTDRIGTIFSAYVCTAVGE